MLNQTRYIFEAFTLISSFSLQTVVIFNALSERSVCVCVIERKIACLSVSVSVIVCDEREIE